jgi:2-amino-4-hydroxy-6-hydroxymethyldihydropteridine diphosphokinase
MVVAYVGIGSNVGDRVAFCRAAVAALEGHPDVELDAASSLYETSPVGGPPQRSFVNMVVRIRTSLDARGLLDAVKLIERQLGREPNEMRWGPRVADLDVLTFDDEKVAEPDLEIPHPRLTQRRFVLVPLLEIDPDAADPWGTPYADALDEAEGDVELLEPFAG